MDYRKADHYPTRYHGAVGITPRVFVFHSTHGGSYSYLNGLFQGDYKRDDGVAVTVHFGCYKDGALVEYAPWKRGEAYQCWHAGPSEWKGETGVSAFSIGVEIQHAPNEPFTDGQIEALIYLVRMVKAEYPGMQWTTHKEISGRLQGKWDPYPPWDTQVWPVLRAIIEGEDDMTKEQADQLDRIFTSTEATSYRESILIALMRENMGEAERLYQEAKGKGIAIRGYEIPPR